jgi:ABC-2 type transport system permease protein/sodium transport system permease protein
MLAQFRALPWWFIIVTLALAPAMFEEFCFRGFFFGALRTRLTGTSTIITSAVIFGLFHEILFPGRLLPTTFLGLVLGWVRLRTATIFPGMLLHAAHNSVLLSIIYFKDALITRGWGVVEQQHLPFAWHVLAGIGIAVGAALLFATTRQQDEPRLEPAAQARE